MVFLHQVSVFESLKPSVLQSPDWLITNRLDPLDTSSDLTPSSIAVKDPDTFLATLNSASLRGLSVDVIS